MCVCNHKSNMLEVIFFAPLINSTTVWVICWRCCVINQGEKKLITNIIDGAIIYASYI